jgi:hypothetical protein
MRAAASALLAGAVLAGCGGSAPIAQLAPGDAAKLREDVAAIRTAAAARDSGAAHTAAVRLRSEIESLQAQGGLSAIDARRLLAAVASADARISTEVRPATAPSPSVGSVPTAPAESPDHGKGHGHDHGGGDGGD